MTSIDRAAIVGATGPTGRELAGVLSGRGVPVLAISRSRPHLVAAFGELEGVEFREADARDPAALQAALHGCDMVFDCVGMAPGGVDEFPKHARGLAAALRATGARCVQVSSYWSYAPLRCERLDESHPREGGPAPIRARREAEDVLLDAGAVIAQLPDFYGPRVHVSTLQNALREAAAGKMTNWVGRLDTSREYTYVPDAMRVVADLAIEDAAFGQRFLVPGSGTITPREICRIAGAHLGRTVKARGAGLWTLRLIALFAKDLREFLPMVPTYLRPLAFDASKLRALLGELPATSYDTAIPFTLDAITRESSRRA